LVGPLAFSSVDTLLKLNNMFRHKEGDLLYDPTIFSSLNYLTITQPDISFVVPQVSQFIQAPCHLNLVVVLRIIQYLLGSSTYEMFFPSGFSIRSMLSAIIIGWNVLIFIV